MLQERFGKVHPALESYREPHPSQNWLVDTFFRLHRRRQYSETGPSPIQYTDMVIMSDKILRLPESLRGVFFHAIEDTDASVLNFLYQQQAGKLEEFKKSSGGRKNNGKI